METFAVYRRTQENIPGAEVLWLGFQAPLLSLVMEEPPRDEGSMPPQEPGQYLLSPYLETIHYP